MHRRRCCLWLASLLVAAFAAAQSEPALEFIHLTDTHILDLEKADPRLAAARKHFMPSSKTLPAFLAESGRKHQPSFFLITGDLTDAFSYAGPDGKPQHGQVEAFLRATAGSPAPLYLALGNHDVAHYGVNPATGRPASDMSVAGEARAAWIAAADCFRKGTYYSFEERVGKATYLFLVLDNGYTAGEISKEQTHWLRQQAARHGDRAIIVATHIPLSQDATSGAIKAALAEARVALVLAGHRHSDGVEEIDLGRDGAVQVRTHAHGYGVNHWRKIRLLQDRIEVSATGEPERVERTIGLSRAAVAAP